VNYLSTPQNRDPVSDPRGFIELVGDEDRRHASGPEALYPGEERLGFGGRQHRGGFVEQKNPRVSCERLEHLEPLFEYCGEVLGADCGIDRETGLLPKVPHSSI